MAQSIKKTYVLETTIGQLVEAVYEAAMEEFQDDRIAHRIALQTLLKKLREERALKQKIKDSQKKAVLRSEFKKQKK